MSLYEILRSGYVTRWHANPDLAHIRETNAEHHARVIQIVFALHPAPSPALLFAAAHHDCGEIIGDLPAPFKARCPDVAAAHAREEALVRAEMGAGYDLTPDEAEWLQLADRLAAYAHVMHVHPLMLRQADWRAARDNLVSMSCRLGCSPGVLGLLYAIEWV